MNPVDSYAAELHDLIDRAFTGELGGRATTATVQACVWRDLPPHLSDFLVGRGLKAQISSYFREKDHENLPLRPEANAAREHVQLELLSVEEFAFVRDGYLARAVANKAQAETIRARCLNVHGVDLAIRVTA